MIDSYQFTISGQVQGVGFRPFTYRLAVQYRLTGWVRNQSGEVIVRVQGQLADIKAFQHAVLTRHPPLAAPHIDAFEAVAFEALSDFSIISSEVSQSAQRFIPPDYFTCNDCLQEVDDSKQRRYRYPFINCTQCGPRYSIIHDLPYDRPNTSMGHFTLCNSCYREYSNPLDRRFHAQPLACAKCGPTLSYRQAGKTITGNEASLSAAVNALKQGLIIAAKGIGGYHLLCDARNQKAVARLRLRKHRPDKPLAVMFPLAGQDKLASVKSYCQPDALEAAALISPQRPVVLIPQLVCAPELAMDINPGLNQIGAMLPYSPLHYLLLKDLAAPLIATSANLSGEPVLTENTEVEMRLGNIADAFLHHNRTIVRPADDSVIRIIAGKKRLLRIGRGMAPLELSLPFSLAEPVLALGGQMKSTIALAWNRRIVISPHIGELDNKRSLDVFKQVISDLQNLYHIFPDKIICDAHPAYASHRFAYAIAETDHIHEIQHHRAHAAILCGEYKNDIPWLCFTWDGTGLGDDQSIWGGEGFYGHAGNWQRLTSIKPFYLQGGEKAAREPWRSACAILWENGESELASVWEKTLAGTATIDTALAHSAWKKRLNTIKCTSMGRLFDAASALLGLGTHSSYEGQGPSQLENLATEALSTANTEQLSALATASSAALPLIKVDELLLADWSELPTLLLDPTLSIARRALLFHQLIAETLLLQATQIRSHKGVFRVGLSGGVFQNRLLSETVIQRLQENGFSVLLPEKIPYNDAGLSYGQIIEAFYHAK